MKITFRFSIAVIGSLLLIAGNSSAQWSPKIKLSTAGMKASLNENAGPCLAASGDTIHVVWSDHRTRGFAIYYTRSIDSGMTWSAPVAITDTMLGATFPAIAVWGSMVHVVWMDSLGRNRASFYKRSLDGGTTWGPVACIDSTSAFWPGIATSGSLVVATLNKIPTPGNSEVYIRRSTDSGLNWESIQQISNASGRSEDPAIAIRGNDIHLSWNDNRTGTMLIYYRHSKDGGVTWGAETPLTAIGSYTSMVALDGSNVDVPYGINSAGSFNVGLAEDTSSGPVWEPLKQLTNGSTGGIYPYEARSGANIHIVYLQFGTGGGPRYIFSTDAGASWSTPILLSAGGQPFIAITGCVLHILFTDSNAVYYVRNPTGNGGCLATAWVDKSLHLSADGFVLSQIFPNPSTGKTSFTFTTPAESEVSITLSDVTGRVLKTILNEKVAAGEHTMTFDASGLKLPSASYILSLRSGRTLLTRQLILTK